MAKKVRATFDLWEKCANLHCINLCGMSLADLPDCCYRDWYDDGITPKVAAKRAVASAKRDYGL